MLRLTQVQAARLTGLAATADGEGLARCVQGVQDLGLGLIVGQSHLQRPSSSE